MDILTIFARIWNPKRLACKHSISYAQLNKFYRHFLRKLIYKIYLASDEKWLESNPARSELKFFIYFQIIYLSPTGLNIDSSFNLTFEVSCCRPGLVRPYSLKIHFVRNFLTGSAVWFFLIILKFVFAPICEIKTFEKIIRQ